MYLLKNFGTNLSHIVSSFLGASKEAPIVTPLMEFVRQRRSVGSGAQVNDSGSSDSFNSILCHYSFKEYLFTNVI